MSTLFGHRASEANLCEENGDEGDGSDDIEVPEVDVDNHNVAIQGHVGKVPAERFSSHHLLILHLNLYSCTEQPMTTPP